MALKGRFIKVSVNKMFEGEIYCAANILFEIIRAYIDHVAGFRNDVMMTGVHRITLVLFPKSCHRTHADDALLQNLKHCTEKKMYY